MKVSAVVLAVGLVGLPMLAQAYFQLLVLDLDAGSRELTLVTGRIRAGQIVDAAGHHGHDDRVP